MKKIIAAVLCVMMLVSALSVSVFAFESDPTNSYEHIYTATFGNEIDGVKQFYFTYIYCNRNRPGESIKYSYLTIGINPEFKEKYPDQVTGVIPEEYLYEDPDNEGSYIKQTGDEAIPWNHQGYPVYDVSKDRDYYIGVNQFDLLSEVLVEEGIVSLPAFAFSLSPNLKKAYLADTSITEIPEACFMNPSLEELTVPATLTKIGDRAFASSKLTSYVIPETVTEIGQQAFESTSSLKSVVIPDSVNTIGKYAFRYSGLESLTIPGTLGQVGESAFECMPFLASVDMQDT